jgi:LPXTG-motif cell wall-anchored protein
MGLDAVLLGGLTLLALALGWWFRRRRRGGPKPRP